METEFLDLVVKYNLQKKLENGDRQAIEFVMNEFQRLEGIIRDYEIVMKQTVEKLNSKSFKKPRNYETYQLS